MALDFPSNPVDGQIFASYSWSATKGVWQAREESATVAITSPVKPETGNPGDIWVNTATGIAFVYYDDGNTAQWMELLSSAVPNVNEIMPVGTIVQTARSSATTGWLLCQGQAISRTTFSSLFAAIGTQYGSGDGSTTFNIPNLQNRVPVGKGSEVEFDTLGETGGSKTHTLTESEIPSHTHTQSAHAHTFSGSTSTDGAHTHTTLINASLVNTRTAGTASYNVDNGGSMSTSSAGSHSHSYSGTTSSNASTINSTGGGAAHNNLQPYIVLNYMIKV